MAAIEIDDRDAHDEGERQDSRLILNALQARRTALGGEAEVPEDDKLTERIFYEAKRRSAQISAAAQGASIRSENAQAKAIPWWLWMAWAAAIAVVMLAFWWLHRQP